MHTQATDRDAEWYEWEDYLVGAVLAGGCDDLSKSGNMLDQPAIVTILHDELARDWPAIERAAELLLRRQTVPGRDMFEVLRGV